MELVPGSHEPPSAEQLARWARRSTPPENEVPGAVAWSVLLGRTDDVAVMLVAASAYSTGLRFDLAVRTRTHREGNDLFDTGRNRSADRLLMGVEYADGRVATNSGIRAWPPEDLPDDRPSLQQGGGGGGGRSMDLTYFLTPVPPAGPLTIVCAWPGRGITETRTVLDGTALVAAVGQVQVLWPDEPGEQFWQPGPPDPPDVPDDSWFARALRPD